MPHIRCCYPVSMPVRLASLARPSALLGATLSGTKGRGEFSYVTALVAALLFAAPGAASAQPTAQPTPGDAAFGVFVRNTQIGREQVTLARTDSGWIITS